MGGVFDSLESARVEDADAYDAEIGALRAALLEAQAKLRDESDRALLIVIDGHEGAGKGEIINLINRFLDPRYVRTHGFGPPSEDERARPGFLRYLDRTPRHGEVAVFLGSQYSEALELGLEKRADKSPEAAEALSRELALIRDLERMLAVERVTLLKLFLHLTKHEQRARLEALESDSHTAWRVTAADRRRAKRHARITKASARILEATDAPHARWRVVDASDARSRDLTCARLVLEALERHVEPAPPRPAPALAEPLAPLAPLERPQSGGAYRDELKRLQERLAFLLRSEEFHASRSLVAAFEGMDAAGKGGAIRRVIDRLDARYYRVMRVGAPDDEERAHPYLWRFHRAFPRRGHATFFDRSWYGRVLVERVEGLASEASYARAYDEIRVLEEALAQRGVIVVKFWLEVSLDEQWRRFEERARVPYKRFKLTEEDLRNRENHPQYLRAAAEMLARNDSPSAPFHRIPGDDKRAARLEVLRRLVDAVEVSLGER